MNRILFTVNLLIVSLLAVRQSVFRNQRIIDNENDPNRDTIYGEFIVAFNLICVAAKNNVIGIDIIQDFLDLFQCYTLNLNIVDQFPNTVDHWIYMDQIHKKNCPEADDNVIVEWDDYCIVSVEEDETIQLFGANQCVSRTVESALWNLDVSSPQIFNGIEYIQYDSLYNPNIDIIVMDTGVDFTHPQFSGIQTQRLFDAYPADRPFDDHGSHCAGTVLGKDYGAFRAASTSVKLMDVRILDSGGYGSLSSVLNGYDSIINYLNTNPGKKVIINMSFGSGNNAEVLTRIERVKAAGGISFAAAGNDNMDARWTSPASSPHAITVGATDRNNDRAYFSNYGDVVDIWAPGVDIKSAFVGGGSGELSGTSMATPLVAGIAANILANDPTLDFDDIKQRLLDYAVNDVNDGYGLGILQRGSNLPRAQASCKQYIPASSAWSIDNMLEMDKDESMEYFGKYYEYLIEVIGVLLIINMVCFGIYFCKRNNRSNKGYKVVNIDSSTEI